MKNLLSIAFAVSAFAGTSFAQECPFSKTQAATEVCADQAKQDSCDAKTNPAVAAFQKLDAAAQKEVVAAMTGMSSTCPMGKRMPETVKTLDRLYTASITKLTAMTTSKAPEAFRKDAAAQLAMVKQLASFNTDTMSTMKAIMGSSCSSEAAAKPAAGECPATGQKAVAKESCPVSDATSLCSSWKAAPAELASMSKCATTTEKMKGYMAVLAKHKIDVMPIVAGNFQKQIAMLKAGAAKLACPKGGLMARNAEVMSACESTKGNSTAVVNYMMTANKLLASMPAMTKTAECGGESCGDKDKGECCSEKKAECCGTKSECSSAKSECSSAKSECSSTKAKTECSSAKSECSSTKAKTECSSAKSECSSTKAKSECSSAKAKTECSSSKQCPSSKQ